MAQPTSNFKVIFLSVFVAAAVFGVLVFAGIVPVGSGSSSTEVQGTVTIWGTFDQTAMLNYIGDFNIRNQKVHLSYVQKIPETFDHDLIEAIAAGSPPDLVILPDNLVWRYKDKMTHVSFASLPAQTFQTTFTSAANIFSMSDGFLALPWASDPVIMYYNRDLLQSAGMAQAPGDWKTFAESIPLLTKKQSDLVLTQPGAALGSYKNIGHARDIFALLFMQSNNPFITNGITSPVVHFGAGSTNEEQNAANSAMSFYTAFADPVKPVYTWNEGQTSDHDAFIQSNLAYYFGTASELPGIRAQNPNLNFSISLPPQAPRGATMTTGRIYGLAIPRTATNQLLSYTAATLMVNAVSEQALITKSSVQLALLPVRRDVLSDKPTSDPHLGTLYSAALVQKTWLDPNPADSDGIFGSLIQNINSSILPVDQALGKAASQLLVVGATI